MVHRSVEARRSRRPGSNGPSHGSPAPGLYLFGVLAWTWSWIGIAASTGRPLFTFPTVALFLIGGLGPLVVSVFLTGLGYRDPALDPSLGAFFRRSYDPRRLSLQWYLGILGIVVLVAFGPVLVDRMVISRGSLASEGLFTVGSAAMLFVGILGGILEEPGWRGYAQEGLQRRMPVLPASLVVGVFWALWHGPLFFIEGTYQAELGWGTANFWSFHLAIVFACPLYAWLYNAAGGGERGSGRRESPAGGVAFAAVFYHAASKVGRELVPDVSNLAEVGVEAGVSLVVVVAAWGWMKRVRIRDPHGR